METLYDVWIRTSPSRNFAAGVLLLTQYAAGAVTPRILARLRQLTLTGEDPNDYELGKLTNALRDTVAPPVIYVASDEPPVVTIKTGTHGGVPTTVTMVPEPNWPASGDWRAGIQEAKPLHKAHSHHHALMVAASTDEERGRHATEIMQNILPALDRIYDQARATGDAAQDEPDAAAPAENPLRRLQSLRTRVSRLRNQLIPAAANAARRIQLEQELAQKLSEIEILETQV